MSLHSMGNLDHEHVCVCVCSSMFIISTEFIIYRYIPDKVKALQSETRNVIPVILKFELQLSTESMLMCMCLNTA